MNKRQTKRMLGTVVIGLMILSQSGCLWLAVGAVAAGGAAAAYTYMQNQVSQEFPTSLDQALAATRLAMEELKFPTMNQKRDVGQATLETKTTDNMRISIRLVALNSRIPAEAGATRITVRVGNLVGDQDVCGRIMNQIASHIAPSTPATSPTLTPKPIPAPTLGAPIQPVSATLPPETAAPPLASEKTPQTKPR